MFTGFRLKCFMFGLALAVACEIGLFCNCNGVAHMRRSLALCRGLPGLSDRLVLPKCRYPEPKVHKIAQALHNLYWRIMLHKSHISRPFSARELVITPGRGEVVRPRQELDLQTQKCSTHVRLYSFAGNILSGCLGCNVGT